MCTANSAPGSTLIAAALLSAVEMLLIYKLWTATNSFARISAPARIPVATLDVDAGAGPVPAV